MDLINPLRHAYKVPGYLNLNWTGGIWSGPLRYHGGEDGFARFNDSTTLVHQTVYVPEGSQNVSLRYRFNFDTSKVPTPTNIFFRIAVVHQAYVGASSVRGIDGSGWHEIDRQVVNIPAEVLWAGAGDWISLLRTIPGLQAGGFYSLQVEVVGEMPSWTEVKDMPGLGLRQIMHRASIDIDDLQLGLTGLSLSSAPSDQASSGSGPKGMDLEDGGSGCLPGPLESSIAFDFDDAPPGTRFPYSVTRGEVTATVTAAGLAYPDAIQAIDSSTLGLVTTAGNVFYETTGAFGNRIRITFSQPLRDLHELYFATNDVVSPGTTVVLDAYLGDQLVGTVRSRGEIASFGLVAEGYLCFHEGLFDSIEIHTANDRIELAIGRFEVVPLSEDDPLPFILTSPVDGDGIVNSTSAVVTGQLESIAALETTVSYVLDGQTRGTVAVSPGTRVTAGRFTISLTGLAEGQHTLVVEAADQQSRVSEQAVVFTVDLTSPTLTVQPIGLGGLIGSSTLQATGSLADAIGVGGMVRYRLDGGAMDTTAVVASPDGTSGTFTIALAGLTPGNHALTIQGSDTAGNLVETLVSFTYDAAPPTVFAEIGREGFTNLPNPVLSGTVSDPFGVPGQIQYTLDGAGAVTVALDRNAGQTAGTFTIPTSGLAEGMHTLQVIATDLVGNSISQSFLFVVDLTRPVLQINPIGNQGYTGRIPISGTLSDERRLDATFQYAFDGGPFIEKALGFSGDDVYRHLPDLHHQAP